MATKKKAAGRGQRSKSWIVCTLGESTYEICEDMTLDEVAEHIHAKPGALIGKAPDYQVFEVPKRIQNFYTFSDVKAE